MHKEKENSLSKEMSLDSFHKAIYIMYTGAAIAHLEESWEFLITVGNLI